MSRFYLLIGETGVYGEKILKDYMKTNYNIDLGDNYHDDGTLLYDLEKQPVYAGCEVYTNGVEEDIFKIGMCLPAGPYVSDEDVKYIVECIREAIV